MKKIALISSGFLRNYQYFLQSYFYKYLIESYECNIYISTWEEDGYGSNSTIDYSDNIITENEIYQNFGNKLKFLRRLPFRLYKHKFIYNPIKNLLSAEPLVLEKYRSKFYSLSQVEIPDNYDICFHIRLDLNIDNSNLYDNIIIALNNYNKKNKLMYTSEDMHNRPFCFGDSFQIFDYEDLLFLQNFYTRLYNEDYLNLYIPAVPEKILYYYYNNEYQQYKKNIHIVPGTISVNRNKFFYA